jgi:hypothetical protein
MQHMRLNRSRRRYAIIRDAYGGRHKMQKLRQYLDEGGPYAAGVLARNERYTSLEILN